MVTESPEENELKARRTLTLLDKLDIPVAHLDFGFVEQCTDASEVEKILRILKSGEEGHYPDFQRFVENRLIELKPKSRALRVETPVLTSSSLETAERQELESDLSEWLGQCESQSGGGQDPNRIFGRDGDAPTAAQQQQPIRGAGGVTTKVEIKPTEAVEKKGSGGGDNFLKPKNPNRIKSWDYDKWDKFNVDAELTKLDIQEMREEEILNQNRAGSETEQQKDELSAASKKSLGPEFAPNSANLPSTSKSAGFSQPKSAKMNQEMRPDLKNQKQQEDSSKDKNRTESESQFLKNSVSASARNARELGRSFIEEIPEDSSCSTPEVAKIVVPKEQKKRFKVIIDDLRVG